MHGSKRFRWSWVLLVGLGCGGGTASGDLPADPSSTDTTTEVPEVPCQRDRDCAGVRAPVCQRVACDPDRGTCIAVPDPDLEGARCMPSDNACALGDGRCKEGVCVPASVKDCDDHDPCTGDSCNVSSGACEHRPLDRTPCDDGNACTEGDRCEAGVCVPGRPICQCTRDDDCPLPENPCLGRYFCNTAESACEVLPGSAPTCEAPQNPCQEAFCDPTDGQCRTRNRPDTTPCDDGDPCTLGDACLGGACVGQARECQDGNPCTEDRCDPATGQCAWRSLSDQPCDDGDPCTVGESCVAGTCQGGLPVFDCCRDDADCDDGSGCSREVCVDHRCRYEPLECSPPGTDCRPHLCRSDRCETIPLFRRQRLLDLSFAGSLPPGARLDPPDGWIVGAEGLSRTAGVGRLHLPPFRTATGLDWLAVHLRRGGQQIRFFLGNTLVPWDHQEDRLAMAPLGPSPQQAIVEILPGAVLTRVLVLHFPRESCGASVPMVSDASVLDFQIVDNGQGEIAAGFLFRAGNHYRFGIQSFDEEGRTLGTYTQVTEEYPVAHPRFRVQGYWDEDRFVWVYGAVEVAGVNRIRRVEYRRGQVIAAGFLSSRADNQFEPALARGSGGTVACYTSHDIDPSGLGIACRRGTGDWLGVNEQTFGDQSQPDVARFPDDRVLVVWSDHEGAIRGRILDDPNRGEFPVQPTVVGARFSHPRVATSAGLALVVFEGEGVPGESGSGVFGRLLRNDLVEPTMVVFRSNLLGDQRSPEVAAIADGFLVTFVNEATREVWVMTVDGRDGTVTGLQVLQSPDEALSPSRLWPTDPPLFFVGFLDASKRIRMDLVSGSCREGWHASGKTCIGPAYR